MLEQKVSKSEAKERPDMKLLEKTARLRIQEKFRERFLAKRKFATKKPQINIGSLEIEKNSLNTLNEKHVQL